VNTGIAPDSFKERLSAEAAAVQIEAVFREVYPEAEFVKVPMPDSGKRPSQRYGSAMAALS
jgi:glycerate kinase